MANYQITQEFLLKSRFFYEFLTLHDRTVARECRDEYINTMSKVYYSYFKEYSSKLAKLQVNFKFLQFYVWFFFLIVKPIKLEEMADKDDMLGSEDKPKSSKLNYILSNENKIKK